MGKQLKIPVVFFGSGPVAAKSLELLLSDFDVIAVVTKPKPQHHRGSFPVLDIAKEHRLPLHTVSNKHELSELIANKPFQTEVAILIDFGIIVGQDVIDYFPRGIINSHFSLLPQWRGADPITFAILSGQAKTGVSLMLLVEAMDEGPVISVGIQELDGTETTPELTEKLIYLSDALLKERVPHYLADGKGLDQLILHEQIPDYPSEPSYSRKLTKKDGELDFTKPAEVLEREIRAFISWPRSHMKIAGKDVIITEAFLPGYDIHGAHVVPGYIFLAPQDLIGVAAGEGTLIISKLIPAGKKEMLAKDFLAGYGPKL